MSTPAPASPEGSASQSTQESNQPMSTVDRAVLEYLRTRGHAQAVQALQESIGDVDGKGTLTEPPVSAQDLVKLLAIFSQKADRPGGNALRDSAAVIDELSKLGNAPSIQNLLQSIGAVGAEDLLGSDPLDKQEGFRELEAWVDGSLDMYRPEFRAILFPIFCHFYLDLVQYGFKDAAINFFQTFSGPLEAEHSSTLHHLSTLLLPSHVQNDELAQRFRNEKYAVRMSRSGFNLLIGWLTEGIGGEPSGGDAGFTGERGKRGRSAVMRVVNNHLRFDVTATTASNFPASAWEESTGLLSALIPESSGGAASYTDPQAFNRMKGELKLGPAPLQEELKIEAERVLREQAMVDRDPSAQYDLHYLQPPAPPGTIAPTLSDLPPHPPNFKTVDVKREVERVRDARKRIRLEPSALSSVDQDSPQAAAIRARALPSVCAYTIHNVPEGVPCCTFSADTSLMAAGFAESYIRLWSLKGERLQGMRSDFSPSNIRDAGSIRRIREKGGSTTRKLVGHSGPVYSVAFDPYGGSAVPPRYLLSSSADATTRLWSLDTMTNVVAYRGHQNPVWDVQWSPMGVYFATASRDRTARLWSTDRVSTLRVYAGHLNDVDTVRFHPNSLYLATGSSDWTARLWDVQKGTSVRVFIGHQGVVSTLAFSPDGRYLASAGEDLAINLWDLGSGKRIKKMTGHTASIYSLAFSAESSMLVSGGADWTLRCWDVKSAGGSPPKRATANGVLANGDSRDREEDIMASTDLVATFPTKRTPLISVQFTPRNLCLVAGPYLSLDQR
ncbi:TFIID and SAGA subunit [Punctularia strigosozonata HHB-11173 SS5]|uniref:TFIID and SAGA subunit n=1 Tax=Punctularia strigosozonata (strain HHB-11173) TaxID=741275 RepID=UPI00044182E8|nr:TFIID and SAGA subunit [Punctularia strigosozonata HHB-11173 SS5]EIN14148.1 TFIID and SAGA subunit [Punctularia strigosozonata HHB-11173 SS5]